MAGLVSTGNILFFLLAYVTILASATNNTTQFGNFTIEWEDFSLFNCSEPANISFSLFTCLPRAGYSVVEDISCLNETTINFDQNTCQVTTSASMLTTVPLMTSQSNTVKQTQTSASITTVTTRVTTARTETATTAKLTDSISTTQSAITSQATTRASTPGSTVSTNTTTYTNTTTSTQGWGVLTNTTTSTPGSVLSTSTTVTSGLTTKTTSMTTMTTTTNPFVSTNSTSAGTTTTTSRATSARDIFNCNETHIGVYCNISSDACAMSQPCLNAATCFPNNSLPFGYRCECLDGFIGYNCELDEHSCLFDTCWHNGTCIPVNSSIPSYNGSNFRCECIQGYNGVYCELKIDLCDEITCENRGMCQTVDNEWECRCLDATLYYGEYCQFKSGALRLREILSKSFAAVAIGAIVTTCSFIVVMDVLKYAFHIDPVEHERDSYRRRRDLQREARRPANTNQPKIALRFQYVT